MNIYDLEKIRLNLFVTSDVDEKNFEYFLKYNKITKEEYSSLLNDYRQFFKRYKVLNEELSFKEPISIYTLFVYMYKNGFLSKDKFIEFKVFYKKYLDIINLYGTNIFSGKGVCRHIGSMLTDILRESDIESYNYPITITELASNTIPAALDDVTAAILNANYAIDYGFKMEDTLYVGNLDEEEYWTLIAARTSDLADPDKVALYKKIVEAVQSEGTKKVYADTFGGYYKSGSRF